MQSQSGKGLIELLVAVAIGLAILATVLFIYSQTSSTTRVSEQESQLNEDGTLALSIMQQQLRMTGYSSIAPNPAAGGGVVKALNVPNYIMGCKDNFADPAAAFDALSCDAGATGRAAFAIRYQADTLVTLPVAGVPSNCAYESILNTNVDGIYVADNRYYVNANNDLVCRGSTGNGAWSAEQVLIPNVEQMVLNFAYSIAIDPDDDGPSQIETYVAAGNAPLDANTPAEWQRVVGVNVCLLMRSDDPVSNQDIGTDAAGGITNYYKDCNGTEQTSSDRFLRRAFKTTIMFRNIFPVPPQA